MGEKDVVSKEIIKDISLYILGIEVDEELTLVDKEWTRVEKGDSDIVFKSKDKIVHIEIKMTIIKIWNYECYAITVIFYLNIKTVMLNNILSI